ncbi:MAG: DNA recombination protein RmuC [Myxococcales bacterium]|nr:DNA recombination protein RmuC [Myxococcales bacterium]MDH3483805.1 DNA recombination protein RmuC [Myxococcales bacterium]
MVVPLLVAAILLLAANLVIAIIVLNRQSAGGSADARDQAEARAEAAKLLRSELRDAREEAAQAARDLREEVSGTQKRGTETLVKTISEIGQAQTTKFQAFTVQLNTLTESNQGGLRQLRETVDLRLQELHQNNEKKLDQMRHVVDEKLQSTLEKRLGESFKLVGDRLEAVQKGLGEMRSLASGVGDLKKVLTNVKTRGTWGEVQLGALLEQILTPEQFDRNVQPRLDSRDVVEFAIRLPGPSDDPTQCVWLPIDSKFPQEDYLRLVEASEDGDATAVQQAQSALLRSIQDSARDVGTKYLNPPRTTDFAILFLPTEGLYAEALRHPGLVERLQREHRIVVAGPTTLAAVLNSLRIGFRTLAIEQRSSEVWKVLAAVKTEFGRFGDVLTKVKRQLETAGRTIDETGVRTRAMERKLRTVEELPADAATAVLDLAEGEPVDLLEAQEDGAA